MQQTSFSAIFLLNKIKVPKFINNALWKKNLDPCVNLVFNEGVRSKLVFRVSLLFDINIKERRSPGNKVTWGLNWTKESWDNAHVQINSVLFLRLVLTAEVSVLFILVNNFFEILKFFNFLNFYERVLMQFLDFNFVTTF